jgi:ubiquinone/menaquinone biosynthesis C-methylase UbiE
MSILKQDEIRDVYRKRARNYDLTANLYYLIGFREWSYRKKAVEALCLHKGATVVELCCGTGLNFQSVEDAIGPDGKLIGVDLTDAMLEQAERRAREYHWSNVELLQSDVASFEFPSGIHGILSTFAITLVPEFDSVIRKGSEALVPGGRWSILDFKLPSNWLVHLAPLAVFLTRPFAVSAELAERHPWESIDKCLDNGALEELYGGFAYISSGQRVSQ